MGPRHLFLMIASCLVLGCQTQPHHTPADPELIAEVRLALDDEVAVIGSLRDQRESQLALAGQVCCEALLEQRARAR